MANQKPLRFNPSTGGFKLFQGDDNFWLDYTNSSGNIVDIQKSTATLFSIGNKGETQIDVAASAAKAALTIGGRPTGGYPYLVLKDLASNEESLRFSSVAYVGKPAPVIESQAANDVGTGFCFRMVANLNADTPDVGTLLTIGHMKTGGAVYQELCHLTASGKLYLDKTTGADLLWTSNGGGNIGESGGSKPANVYALTTVNAAGTVIKTNAMDLGPQAATDKTITALQTGTNDPKFQYKVGVGWQFTNDGTTWLPLIGAASITWDTVYDNDADGLTIDTVGRLFPITQTTTTGSAFTVTRGTTTSNSPLVQFTCTHANDIQVPVYISSESTGASYGLHVSCLGSGSSVVPLYIRQATNSAGYALDANGTLYTSRSYRGGSYSNSAIYSSASRTNAFSTDSGRFLKAGYFEVIQGVDALATCYYVGVDLACTPAATSAQSYGVKVDPDFRVGAHYGGTVFDQWTNIDRSAIVIDTASYATADSYGIVFTSSAAAQRPSNLLASGSTALLVNSSWDYSLYGLSKLYVTDDATNSLAVGTFANSATVALGGGEYRSTVISTSTGHTDDPATAYCASFRASTAGTGSGVKLGFYADTTLGYGVYSLVSSWFQRTALTTDSTAVYGTVASTPPALGANQYRNIFSSDLRGHASDAATSVTAAYHAKVASSGGTTTGGIFAGLYADNTLTYGFYSEAKGYVEQSHSGAVGGKLAVLTSQATQVTAGLEDGDYFVCYDATMTPMASADGSNYYVGYYSTGSATVTAGAEKRGFFATADHDYGLYSLAKTLVNAPASINNSAVYIRNSSPTVLSGTDRRPVTWTAAGGNASDPTGTFTDCFSASSGGTGSSAKCGYHAASSLDYGVYSLSKIWLQHTNAGGFGGSLTDSYVVSASAISSGTGLVTGDVFRCYNAEFTPLNVVSGTAFYCGYYATGSATSTTAGKIGFYATANHDYGVWTQSKAWVDYSNTSDSTASINALYVKNATSGISGGTKYRYGVYIDSTSTGTISSPAIIAGASAYTTANSNLAASSYLVGYRTEIQPYVSQTTDDVNYIGFDANITSNHTAAGRTAYRVASNYGLHATNGWSIKSEGGRALFQQTTSTGWTAPTTYDLLAAQLTSGGETNASDLFAAVRGTVTPSSSDTNNARFASLAADCNGANTGTSTYYGLYVSDAGSATANMTKTGVRVYKWPANQMAIHVAGESSGEGGKVGLYQNWGTITTDQTHVEISTSASLSGAGLDMNCLKIAATGSMLSAGGGQRICCLYLDQTESSSDVSLASRYGTYAAFTPDATPAAISIAHFVDNQWMFGFVSSALTNKFSRLDGEYDDSNTAVFQVENNATGGAGAAHAMTATLGNSASGQYAVALANTAYSSSTAGTMRHIGFVSAKTNTRAFPITNAVPNGTDYTFTISIAGTSHWICPNTTDNGKLLEMPLMLPHGCTLNAVRVVAKPGAANATESQRSLIRLFKNAFGSAVYTEIGSVDYDDGTDTKQTLAISGLSEVIDNTDYRYVIRFRNVSVNASTAAYVDSYRAEYAIQDLGAAPGY